MRVYLLAIILLVTACDAYEGVSGDSAASGFKPSSEPGVIDWKKFPTFHLAENLTAVWQGPHLGSSAREPLNHGFTHIANRGSSTMGTLSQPAGTRAILWTMVAYEKGQPWAELKSPWGNDMAVYKKRWERYWRAYAGSFADSKEMDLPNADIISADIEARLENPADILKLRNAPSTPPAIKALDDKAFIDRYERDMARLYEMPLQALRDAGFKGKITSYSDVPIMRNWWDIPKHTWSDWGSNRRHVNTILANPDIQGPAWKESYGEFYESLDVLSPSAYFFYPYPGNSSLRPLKWKKASHWLSYLLFQVEANRAWSDKDQILFLWMNFHTKNRTRIKPHMAHGAAVFPFLAGAKGVWLWAAEDHDNAGSTKASYAAYEWFVHGLHQLSEYNSFFEGAHTFWAPEDPVALQKGGKAVMRGVISGNRILLGVQNPYANDSKKTTVDIVYKNKSIGKVELAGPKLWLGVFNLPGD